MKERQQIATGELQETPMKTRYYKATGLDGFIATEDHSLEWLFQPGDVDHTSCADFFSKVGALATGAST